MKHPKKKLKKGLKKARRGVVKHGPGLAEAWLNTRSKA
jgi:hypothetical protein